MIPLARPFMGEEEAQMAREAILSGWVTQGPKVKAFEGEFARFIGASYACAVSSCTAALHLALLVVGVKPGDVVLTVSHSFIASANCIRLVGAEPIFLDIDLETYNISVDSLQRCLQESCFRSGDNVFYKNGSRTSPQRVAAVLIVHQMGLPCDLEAILPLAQKFNVPVIEDAACATGSEISFNQGKTWEKIGKPHGHIACFSFHPRKIITTGEGGMITTRDEHLDEKLRLLRHQGMSVSDEIRHKARQVILERYDEMGFNYRLTDIQAAVGLEQLKRLPQILSRRRHLAEQYHKELSKILWLKPPQEPSYARTNWQSFPVRVLDNAPLDRDRLMQYLLDHNISSRAGIMNAHQEKPYQLLKASLKNSELARESVILLPLYSQMGDEEFQRIISCFKNA